MVEPDTIIDGRYRVVSRLGSGGMADVYLAEDQLLGRQLAVKVLHHHFAEDQEFVERFRREASSAARLQHPNIVGIFDRGEWDGTYYIAMEYVPGRSLKALVREQGPLAPVVAVDVVIQILRAAGFAHGRGVIHRDLKPHNVILDDEGRARVTDFGIAHAGASDMTMTGSIMGTAQYLSPEQAQGHAISAASDLYAVGVILYELLTGGVPFDGDTAVAIAFKQVSAQPPAPSAVNPAVPAALDTIVLRALAKDPLARYGSAEEFIAALRAVRARLPAASATELFVAVPQTPGATGSALHGVAPAGMALSTGVPPAALLLPPDGTGAATPEDEDARAKRRKRLWWALAAALVALVVALILVLALTRPSAGGKVRVPSVAGQSEAAAATRLRAAGLVPVPALSTSASVPNGTVIAASPPPGSLVARGTRVTISVSTGPGSAPLPDVAGISASRAKAKLTQAGYTPVTESQPSATVASGHVISTDPPAGTELQFGSQVTVLVSSGPVQITVPDVVGEPRAAAEATLTNAKLTVGAVTQQTSSEQSPGTVLEQSPAAGSSLVSGGKVDLVVAQAPQEATVPDVRGAAGQAASHTLERAGFKVEKRHRKTSEPAQKGVVLEQSPAGGTRVRKGSTVTIEVGELAQTTTTTTTTTAPPTPATPPAASG